MRHQQIRELLPEIFRRTDAPASPLASILDAMEELHIPTEQVLAGLDAQFDPRRCTDPFVSFLARWVDLDWIIEASRSEPLASGIGRLRELIAGASAISRWRGTSKGLVLFLETATGLRPFRIEEQPLDATGRPRPFFIRVHSPHKAEIYRRLIDRIVQSETPIYVETEIQFDLKTEP